MGGVASAISNVVQSVGDVVESVGDVVQDVGKAAESAVNDAGTWIDKSIITPIKENPVETAVMIAAVAYGGPLVAGYLGTTAAVGTAVATGTAAAGITASKGGDVEDILKAGVIGAAAGGAGGAAGTAVGGTYGAAAGNIAKGAVTGATGATLAGKDPLQGAAIGAATAGIAEGVNISVNAAADFLNSTTGDFNFGTTPEKTYEFGINPNAPSATSGFGINPALPASGTDINFGTSLSPDYNFGINTPTSSAVTPLGADYGTIQTELGLSSPAKEFGIDPNKEGGIGIKYNPDTAGYFGQINPNLGYEGLQSQYVLGSQTNPFKEEIKKTATKAIASELLPSSTYGGGTYDPTVTLRYRTGLTPNDELLDPNTKSDVSLAGVSPDKFELRKFASKTGATTLISFKNNKPQQPIPTGYEEVERIGAAEGGLISTNMVKYSKKPLVAKRKPELVDKTKTSRKGLAGKKS